MFLTVSAKMIASIEPQAVQLLRLLGAFELCLLFSGTVQQKAEYYRCLAISGARVTVRSIGGHSLELGTAFSEKAVVLRQGDNSKPEQFTLRLPLQPHQVDLMENVRDGGDLNLSVKFLARGSDSRSSWFDWEEAGDMALQIPVPESAWVKQMNASGADRILLFEVRVPSSDGALPHPAARHLLKAQQHLVGGNWRECVSECRQFAEQLGGGRLTPATDRLASGRRSMSKDEREAVLLAALLHYGHLAAHSESQHGELDFDRADAKLALSLAASLAAHHFRRE